MQALVALIIYGLIICSPMISGLFFSMFIKGRALKIISSMCVAIILSTYDFGDGFEQWYSTIEENFRRSQESYTFLLGKLIAILLLTFMTLWGYQLRERITRRFGRFSNVVIVLLASPYLWFLGTIFF